MWGEQILLLFTERYNDFSFPGGGLDGDEDIATGLKRELEEETGAREIQVLQHYGYIEEYRPYWKPQYDLMHMTSHFYQCEVAPQLEPVRMESHEIANGMRPVWINLHEAISHNEAVMQRQDSSMGQSIQRETFMLKKLLQVAGANQPLTGMGESTSLLHSQHMFPRIFDDRSN